MAPRQHEETHLSVQEFCGARPRSRTDGMLSVGPIVAPSSPKQGPSSPCKSPPRMILPPSSFCSTNRRSWCRHARLTGDSSTTAPTDYRVTPKDGVSSQRRHTITDSVAESLIASSVATLRPHASSTATVIFACPSSQQKHNHLTVSPASNSSSQPSIPVGARLLGVCRGLRPQPAKSVASSSIASGFSGESDTESVSSVVVNDSKTNLARHFNCHYCFQEAIAHPQERHRCCSCEGPSTTPVAGLARRRHPEDFMIDGAEHSCLDCRSSDATFCAATTASPLDSPCPSRRMSCADGLLGVVVPSFSASPLLSCTLDQIRRSSCGGQSDGKEGGGGVPDFCLTVSQMDGGIDGYSTIDIFSSSSAASSSSSFSAISNNNRNTSCSGRKY
eukprot:GHVS01038656.1.p1 GENE.GHVS01038656.1~~GHVS01038656.1.p1  ORF type:complete len:411 (+),score=53.66 GHVS01038656.1:67-1233(+)